MDFVSAGKNTLLLYVTVYEKVVLRLNKHDNVIKWNFMKISPLEMKSWLRPCFQVSTWKKLRTHATSLSLRLSSDFSLSTKCKATFAVASFVIHLLSFLSLRVVLI